MPRTGPEPKNLVYLTLGGRELLRTTRTRFRSAGNFVFMYGVFHFLYFFFIMLIWQMSGQGLQDLPGILFSCAVFFAAHLISYLHYRKQQKPFRFNADEFVTGPIKRILPMHLTILGGVYFLAQAPGAVTETNRLGILFFLCLKTLMDLEGHQWKHRAPAGEETGMEGT